MTGAVMTCNQGCERLPGHTGLCGPVSMARAMGTWRPGAILTASGRMVCPLDPDPVLIVIEDIAHALAHLCRFGGHSRRMYSVAEHCVLGLQFVPEQHKLAWLLHDATEAYLGDVVSPIKNVLLDYQLAEKRLADVIAKKFGLTDPCPEVVHDIDRRMLAMELRDLLPHHPGKTDSWFGAKPMPIFANPVGLSPNYWKQSFVDEFEFWMDRRNACADEVCA